LRKTSSGILHRAARVASGAAARSMARIIGISMNALHQSNSAALLRSNNIGTRGALLRGTRKWFISQSKTVSRKRA